MPGYDLAFHITAFLIFIGVLVVAHLIVRRADQRRYEALEDKQAELQKETARAARSENASRLRQEWYRMLFSHTRNMVLVYGVTPEGLPGRFLDANDIACDKLDVSRDRLLRMTPLDIEAPAALPNRLQ
jgi:PAS domain-containing protein